MLEIMDPDKEVFVAFLKPDGTGEIFDIDALHDNNGDVQLDIYEAEASDGEPGNGAVRRENAVTIPDAAEAAAEAFKVPQAPAGFVVGGISRNLRGSAGARGPLRSGHPVVIFLDPSCRSTDVARQPSWRSSRQGSRKILHRNEPVLAPSLRSSPCAYSVPAVKPLTALGRPIQQMFLFLRRKG